MRRNKNEKYSNLHRNMTNKLKVLESKCLISVYLKVTMVPRCVNEVNRKTVRYKENSLKKRKREEIVTKQRLR